MRILDVGGPPAYYATKLLADLGAEVVRLESRRDPALSHGPFWGSESEPDRSLYRWHFHTNKKSIEADLAGESGREVFRRLLGVADVVVETLTPSEATAVGVDAKSVRDINPKVIHVTISPFGSESPRANYVATDIVGQAMSGLMALTGFPEDPPNQLGAEQAYHQASLHAAAGVLLALHAREADGTGRDVEVVIQDSASIATLQTANLNYYLKDGTIRKRAGLASNAANPGQRRNPSFRAPAGPTLRRCKDGWITFTIPPLNWGNFVAWLDSFGAAAELLDPRFEDPDTQQAEREYIVGIQTRFFLKHTAAEIYHSAQKFGLLVMPVNSVADLVADEQLQSRQFFVEVAHPELGARFMYPGAPYRFSRTPWEITRRAPLIGEDGLAALSG